MDYVSGRSAAYDDAVLSDDNMVPNSRCFNDRVGADMNVVTDLHWIIIEISAVRFVWWSMREAHWDGCL